ncbi:MAG: PEP-CTERM sorting domain-containing protein [Verrucomicrobiaceae bacterium]
MKTWRAAIILLMIAGSETLPARSINWGSNLLSNLFDSNGVALDDAFKFEIGSFQTGFIPDSTNLNLWETNWKVFDHAEAPAGNGWNSALRYIASTANLTTGGTSSESPPLPAWTFSQNEKGYLWAFNSQTYASGVEWALITNNASDGNSANDWLFPSPADQTSQPLDWKLLNASVAIFGGLNNVESAGTFSVNPGTFNLQTHQPVPEPGSALLLMVAACAVGIRRTRSP